MISHEILYSYNESVKSSKGNVVPIPMHLVQNTKHASLSTQRNHLGEVVLHRAYRDSV
jgi:hypothetical protein